MELLLYNNKSDNNVLNKSIEKIGETIVLNAKEEISLLQPVFIIAVDKTTSNLNYCYCPTFNRYYYINNIDIKNIMIMLNLILGKGYKGN